MSKATHFLKKTAKILGYILLGIVALVLLVILLIRVPWVQNKITSYATNYVSEKTNTEVEIDKLFITFRGNVELDGVYLEGLNQDTLLYSQSLEAGVGVRSLISGNLQISRVDWDGLTANIKRGKDSTFNFQFLIDALAPAPKTDTTQAPADSSKSGGMNLSVGPIHLSDFDISYLDSLSGIDAKLALQSLDIFPEEINLDSMFFDAGDLALKGVEATVVQFAQPPPSNDTSSSGPMPTVAWDDVSIQDVNLAYRTKPDTLETRAEIGQLIVGKSNLALEAQNISSSSLELQHSRIYARLPEAKPSSQGESDTSSSGFSWPEWQVELEDISMSENNFEYHQGPGKVEQGVFDPQHITLQDFELEIPTLSLSSEKTAALNLAELSFTEGSGFQLQQTNLKARLDRNGIDIENLLIETKESAIYSQAGVKYASLEDFLQDPLKAESLSLNIRKQTSLSITTAYYFNDSLRYDSLIQQIAPYPIGLDIAAKGPIDDIEIDHFQLHALQNTSFEMRGRVRGLPDTNQVQLTIPNLQLSTTDDDIALIIDTAGTTVPERLKLRASINGGVERLKTRLQLQTPSGDMGLDAVVQNLLETPAYQGELTTENLAIGGLIGVPELSEISLDMKFDGSGTQPEKMNLETNFAFQKLIYQNYNYEDLKLDLSVDEGTATADLKHRDQNLRVSLDAKTELASQQTTAKVDLDLTGADLQDLGFTQRPVKIASNLNAKFEGTPDAFDARLKVQSGIFISNETTYRLDSLVAKVHNDTGRSRLKVGSPFLEGELESNTNLQTLASSLQTYLQSALGQDTAVSDTAFRQLEMQGDFVVRSSPLFSEILLPGLSNMDSVQINTTFRPAEELLRLDVKNSRLTYMDATLSDFHLDIDANYDSTQLYMHFDRLERDPVAMYNTSLKVDLTGGDGRASLQIMDADENEVFYSAVNIDQSQDVLQLSVDPSKLILNSREWSVPSDNSIAVKEAMTVFQNFKLSNQEKYLSIKSKEAQGLTNINFNEFDIEALFSIFNAEEAPVQGKLQGSLSLLNQKTNPAFEADVRLNDFGLLGTDIGYLTLDANNLNQDNYEMMLGLKGQNINLDVDGTYSAEGKSPNIDLTANLKNLGLPLLQSLAPSVIDSSAGNITGEFSVEGPVDDISYNGTLNFQNAALVPTSLGTLYKLGDEQLKIDNKGLGFQDFTLTGARDNTLTIDGEVGTENLTNPTFDLEIDAENFVFLDSEESTGQDYYGKAVASLDISVSGDLNLPKVEADIDLQEETDMYYVVPTSRAQMVSREGIVQFKNMKDTTAILTAEEDSIKGVITGYDVDANIDLASNVRFTVIIDPQSGDNLTVAGQANLQYNLRPNGNSSLTGSYTLDDGSYELNLYELIKKKFVIKDGSRITWTGDPNEAALDLTAEYTAETAPASLMTDPSNIYKQKVPFEVLLYIRGTISEPEVSFGLDMPEDVRGEFGGSVYQRIQQLNENESELNKQVFSLVVFNRFLPSGSVGDEGGGTSDLARSSVANLLSGQLNKLADKYVAGVEVNLDLDSYTDYRTGSAQRRTDLNVSLQKAFFDDKVIVKVGTEVGIEGQRENAAAVGNVSVEYKIDENGNYRAQAFRKDQYQNIVEGQVIITGLGLLFNKDFDTWEELWAKDEPAQPTPDPEEKNTQEGKATENKSDDNPDPENQKKE